MSFARHRDFSIQRLTIGAERAPLMVIDNALADADALVRMAATKMFGDVTSYYPGVRAKVPLTFQKFVLDELREEFVGLFGMDRASLRFTACHFSLVTTPAEKLGHLQRIPHIDSVTSSELAFILYLFKTDLGGTSFYRHRKSGFEVVDETRFPGYSAIVEAEREAVLRGPPAYINGSNDFYEEVGRQEGVFNRMLIYRRTSLHSGNIRPNFVPVTDPRKGRLSVNGFIA
jgi:uncharacterized protein DUF6445